MALLLQHLLLLLLELLLLLVLLLLPLLYLLLCLLGRLWLGMRLSLLVDGKHRRTGH
jgi:hypothetical protein